MLDDLGEQQRHAGGGFRDHAHGAVDDGVPGEAFAGEAGVVARRPGGLVRRGLADQRADGGGFGMPGVGGVAALRQAQGGEPECAEAIDSLAKPARRGA
jgi:hypothetical protein